MRPQHTSRAQPCPRLRCIVLVSLPQGDTEWELWSQRQSGAEVAKRRCPGNIGAECTPPSDCIPRRHGHPSKAILPFSPSNSFIYFYTQFTLTTTEQPRRYTRQPNTAVLQARCHWSTDTTSSDHYHTQSADACRSQEELPGHADTRTTTDTTRHHTPTVRP